MHRALLAALLLAFCADAPALQLRIDVGSIEHSALPAPLEKVSLSCSLTADTDGITCRQGRARAQIRQASLDADFRGRVDTRGRWRFRGVARARNLTLSESTGRYASEKLDLDLDASAEGRGDRITSRLSASLPRGQLYVEPVFLDFGPAPLRLDASIELDTARDTWRIDLIRYEHSGVLGASGLIRKPARAGPDLALNLTAIQLGPAFATYAQPFLAGTRMEKLALSGTASATLETRGGAPLALSLQLAQAGIESETFGAGLREIGGAVHWNAERESPVSSLHWSGGHIAKLDIGPAALKFRTRARDLALLDPLRLPLAGGALRVQELAVQHAGQPDMSARFDAQIEPIDLAALCRAFGWPEFGGQLGGRLPGLSLKDRELRLDGALMAQAFDGRIAVENLRVLDPLGRVPRVMADIRMRNLDLAALTGAFSFGRIEGRIDGDVEDLRLLDWQPVAFRARLATPRNDKSRHRISQRAIDNISSIGGGPSGVLSRGALRFFEDFAYARIGWSCVLADGVCRMDGIGPSKNGGYVLVQGRLLPRIDVVGFSREVDWNTFVAQLQSARQAQGVEVR